MISAIKLPRRGPELFGNIWQKVRSTLMSIHDLVLDEYDWFWISGDDVYLFVDSLRQYLRSDDVIYAQQSNDNNNPLYIGQVICIDFMIL
jgi:hypothetical protein